MFTFIHAADIHLDSPLVGLSQHENAPVETIRGATRTALTNLVSLALEREVDFLLIAGDLYDGNWKDYNTGLFFIKEMRRLNDAGIPVYLIFGNHDAESTITKSLNLPGNVHVFSTKKPESYSPTDLPVTIHGQGFATQAVTENLAEKYPVPVAGHFNIGLLHTNLGDREGHGNYAPSTVNQLVGHGYDYWALGHIHLREVHNENPHVVYSGNTQGRHANETGAKGCYVVSVSDELEVDAMEFCELDTVRWFNLEVDCSEFEAEHELLEQIRQQMTAARNDADGRLLATRIRLIGSTVLHEVLHAEQARYLAECVSLADDIDAENLWIEGLRVKTTSRIDPEELAKRDDLTAMVLEALDSFDPTNLPDPVLTLKSKLPSEIQVNLEDRLNPESDGDKKAMRDDVAAIVWQAIATSASSAD